LDQSVVWRPNKLRHIFFHISLFCAASILALWRLPREKADTWWHR